MKGLKNTCKYELQWLSPNLEVYFSKQSLRMSKEVTKNSEY